MDFDEWVYYTPFYLVVFTRKPSWKSIWTLLVPYLVFICLTILSICPFLYTLCLLWWSAVIIYILCLGTLIFYVFIFWQIAWYYTNPIECNLTLYIYAKPKRRQLYMLKIQFCFFSSQSAFRPFNRVFRKKKNQNIW